jgi:HlyD family secretion protein
MTEASMSSLGVKRRKSSWSKWVVLLVVLTAAGTGAYWYFNRESGKPAEYRTAKISPGDITQTVTANGQLTPVKNVQVGSQISGTIIEISADFNSKVKKGELIAKIDPATYERNLSQAEAELANATAAQELADLNFKRGKELFANKLISEADYNRAEVDLHQAQAIVKMRQANVERAKVDLDRTKIFAPIDGVVISRNIEEGQTVAASFNTPTLFLIANDLAKMQIEAAVSEADVGGVQEGQQVSFSVDAFPTRSFPGVVKQVRYQPVTNQNVVTYTSIVGVDNSDLKLRPGMTANASIVVKQKKNALRIPNSALRFRPPEGSTVQVVTNAVAGGGSLTNQTVGSSAGAATQAEMLVPPWAAERRRPTQEEREKWESSLTPEQREQYRQRMERMRARFAEGGGGGGFGGGGLGGFAAFPSTTPDGPRTQTIYVLENKSDGVGKPKPALKGINVKLGITDGTNTEVLEGLSESDLVVTGLMASEPAPVAMGSSGPAPFGSPFGRGGRGPR